MSLLQEKLRSPSGAGGNAGLEGDRAIQAYDYILANYLPKDKLTEFLKKKEVKNEYKKVTQDSLNKFLADDFVKEYFVRYWVRIEGVFGDIDYSNLKEAATINHIVNPFAQLAVQCQLALRDGPPQGFPIKTNKDIEYLNNHASCLSEFWVGRDGGELFRMRDGY